MKFKLAILFSIFPTLLSAQDTLGLFFSEYIENGWTKALEIFNPTCDTVNLKDYKIVRNGKFVFQMPDQELPPHDVWVGGRYDPGYPPAPEVLAVADSTWPATGSIWYLSNIARIELLKNDTVIDRINTDPPVPDVAGISGTLQSSTLVRKKHIHHGETDWDLSRGTDADNSQWIVKSVTYEYLGWHEIDMLDPTKDTTREITSEEYLISGDTIYLPFRTPVDTFYSDISKPDKSSCLLLDILWNAKKSAFIEHLDRIRITSEAGPYRYYVCSVRFPENDSIIGVESLVYYFTGDSLTNVVEGTNTDIVLKGIHLFPDGVTAEITDAGLITKNGQITNGDELVLTAGNGSTKKIFTIYTNDPVAGSKFQAHQIAEERQLPAGSHIYSQVNFTTRWPRGPGLRAGPEPIPAAKSFFATNFRWVYTTQTANKYYVNTGEWVRDWVTGNGFKIGSSLNPSIMDYPGETVTVPLDSRAEDQNGNLSSVMCFNKPDARKAFMLHVKAAVDMGNDYTFQVDDPHGFAWVDTVCYCKYCKAKANEWKLDFKSRQFKERVTHEFWKWINAESDIYSGLGIGWSCNNSSYHRFDTITSAFDFFIGECDPRWGYGPYKYIEDERMRAEPNGKMQIYNLSVKGLVLEDPTLKWRNRSITGLAYGVGGNCVLPWDSWMHPPVEERRYFGKPEDYADLYGFIRANSRYLDGFETVYDYADSLIDQRFAGDSPVSINDNSRAFAFVRAVPGDSVSPIVIHLVDWKESREAIPITLNIKPEYFYNGRPFAAYLLKPQEYNKAIHEMVIMKADLYRKPGEFRGPQHEAVFASMAGWKKLDLSRSEENIEIYAGEIPTYSIIILIPEGTSLVTSSDVYEVDNINRIITGFPVGTYTTDLLSNLKKVPGTSWFVMNEKNEPVFGQIPGNSKLIILSPEGNILVTYSLNKGNLPDLSVKMDNKMINYDTLVTFNDTPVGSVSEPLVFTLINNGVNNLIISSVHSSSAFDVLCDIDTLPAGSSELFKISFSPDVRGLDSSLISIITEEKKFTPFRFSVKGNGLAPEMVLHTQKEIIEPSYGHLNLGEVITSRDSTISLWITNTGDAQLNINEIISSELAIFKIIDTVKMVNPGGTNTFKIQFDPADRKLYQGVITISSNDPVYADYYFSIEGTGIPIMPRLFVIQNGVEIPDGTGEFSFDTLGKDQDTTVMFFLRNVGDLSLVIAEMESNNPVIQLTGEVDTIFPGLNDTIYIKYDPTTLGTSVAIITLKTNESGDGQYSFTVRGTYFYSKPEIDLIYKGSLVVSDVTEIDFGSIYTNNDTTLNIVIWSHGNADLFVSKILSDQDAFEICDTVFLVSPGSTETFRIKFKPVVEGEIKGTITVQSNDQENETFIIKVKGTGLQSSGLDSPDHLVKIFPNPAPGKFFVEYPGIYDLNLYDLHGRKFMMMKDCYLHSSIDLRSFKGIVILEILSNKTTFRRFVIIE